MRTLSPLRVSTTDRLTSVSKPRRCSASGMSTGSWLPRIASRRSRTRTPLKARANRSTERLTGCHCLPMHVAGQGQQVDLDAVEHPLRHLGDGRQAVEMRVADMEDAIAIERGRQSGEGNLEFGSSEIECVAETAPIERCQPQAALEHPQQGREHAMAPPRPRAVGTAPVARGLHRAAADGPFCRCIVLCQLWPRTRS